MKRRLVQKHASGVHGVNTPHHQVLIQMQLVSFALQVNTATSMRRQRTIVLHAQLVHTRRDQEETIFRSVCHAGLARTQQHWEPILMSPALHVSKASIRLPLQRRQPMYARTVMQESTPGGAALMTCLSAQNAPQANTQTRPGLMRHVFACLALLATIQACWVHQPSCRAFHVTQASIQI